MTREASGVFLLSLEATEYIQLFQYTAMRIYIIIEYS